MPRRQPLMSGLLLCALVAAVAVASASQPSTLGHRRQLAEVCAFAASIVEDMPVCLISFNTTCTRLVVISPT